MHNCLILYQIKLTMPKIILIGEGDCGKTTFVKYLCETYGLKIVVNEDNFHNKFYNIGQNLIIDTSNDLKEDILNNVDIILSLPNYEHGDYGNNTELRALHNCPKTLFTRLPHVKGFEIWKNILNELVNSRVWF